MGDLNSNARSLWPLFHVFSDFNLAAFWTGKFTVFVCSFPFEKDDFCCYIGWAEGKLVILWGACRKPHWIVWPPSRFLFPNQISQTIFEQRFSFPSFFFTDSLEMEFFGISIFFSKEFLLISGSSKWVKCKQSTKVSIFWRLRWRASLPPPSEIAIRPRRWCQCEAVVLVLVGLPARGKSFICGAVVRPGTETPSLKQAMLEGEIHPKLDLIKWYP